MVNFDVIVGRIGAQKDQYLMRNGALAPDAGFAKSGEVEAEILAIKRYEVELTIRSPSRNHAQAARVEIEPRAGAVRLFVEQGNYSPKDLLDALNGLGSHLDAHAIFVENRNPGAAAPRLRSVTGDRQENPIVAVVQDPQWLFAILHTARDNGGFTSKGNLRLDFTEKDARRPKGF